MRLKVSTGDDDPSTAEDETDTKPVIDELGGDPVDFPDAATGEREQSPYGIRRQKSVVNGVDVTVFKQRVHIP